jgi:hypothetical protein
MALYRNGAQITEEELKAMSKEVAPAQVKPTEEPGWFQPGSKSEAALRGFSNAATLGTGKYIGGAVNALANGENPMEGIRREIAANQRAAEENPWSYGAGSVAGAAPMGAAAAGKSLLTQAGVGAGTTGLTTLADTGDVKQAALAAGLGGALPLAGAGVGKAIQGVKGGQVVDYLASKLNAPEEAINRVSSQVQQLGRSGQAVGLVDKGKLVGTNVRPAALAQQIQQEGLDVLKQPQWAAVKDYVVQKNPSTLGNAVGQGYKEAGIGGALGGTLGGALGMPGTGATLGTIVGSVKGAKAAATNREIAKTLSPAAKKGQEVIQQAISSDLANKARTVGEGIGSGGRFAAITNMLNQTSPEARAAMNEENPLNEQ